MMIALTSLALITHTLPDAQAHAETLSQHSDIPAAAIVMTTCETIQSAQAGFTDLHGLNPVSAQTRFNLGSNSKSVLATAAAMLVQEGQISWQSRVADITFFQELTLEPTARNATLERLFAHTSGLATYHTGSQMNAVHVEGPAQTHPRQFASQALQAAPEGDAGTYAYSNAGPVVAALMLEDVSGQDWLSLLQDRVFMPWRLNAQLDTPQPETHDQLYGHYATETGLTRYDDPEPEIPAFVQPSGYLAMTPQSYGRYLRHHVCGLQGHDAPGLLAAGFEKLHTPLDDTPSALGWARFDRNGTSWSFHIGSTGAHYAYAMINEHIAIAVLVNSGTPAAAQAAQSKLLELADLIGSERP